LLPHKESLRTPLTNPPPQKAIIGPVYRCDLTETSHNQDLIRHKLTP
jgi:hypothetical protein